MKQHACGKLQVHSAWCCIPLFMLQSEANEKLNELEEQLQQIKDQIKVGLYSGLLPDSSCSSRDV